MVELAHFCVAECVAVLAFPVLIAGFPEEYFVLGATWGGAADASSGG